MEGVTLEDLKELLNYFTKISYQAKKVDAFCASVQEKCEKLFSKDYKFSIVNNTNGELCNTYPSRIIFLEGEKDNPQAEDAKKPNEENINDATRYRQQISKSKLARYRKRFPVPVILFDGKYICRSSTLATGKEINIRLPFDFSPDANPTDAEKENANTVDEYGEIDFPTIEIDAAGTEPDKNVGSKVGEYRSHDIQLLKDLSVTKICDLMTEEKRVKSAEYVTSSEKVDKHNRYKDFTILSLPFPGADFFHKFKEFNYHGERMKFDWTQSYINRTVEIPHGTVASFDIEWALYKEWDFNTLTQNYMKVLLKTITEGSSSLLIHCIAGWDRTPMFISLMRMCLWADGRVHRSLTALEMVYLTVSYDWFLFAHQLGFRLSKGQEIIKYCFYCLKFLSPPDFSVIKMLHESSEKPKAEAPRESVLLQTREVKLNELQQIFLSIC